MAYDILFSSYCHSSDHVIIERILTKTLSFVDFSLFNISLKQSSCTLLNDIKWRSRIAFFNNILAFVISESDKGRCHFLLLLRLQKLIECHALQKLLIGLKFTYDYLFNGFSETNSIYDPKSTSFLCYGSWWSIYLIQQGEFAKTLSTFHLFLSLLLNFDLDRATLDDKEASTSGTLAEYFGSLGHFDPKHVLSDIFDLSFRQIIEDEMIFECW